MRKSAAVVRLGDDLRITQARATYESIVACIEREDVTIDAAKVARIDAAGLQAIAAGIARLHAADVRLQWVHVPDALAHAAALAGIDEVLQLP
jgi:anti-anti-sigma regulatory factor